VRASGGAFFSLGLAAIAGYAVAAAWSWPLKAALFPLVTGVPLVVLAAVQLVLQLRDPEPPAMQEVRKTLAAFAWMAAFILLVLFAGFPTAVPLFVFFYLALRGSVGWVRAIALSAAAWGLFHLLFERLLSFPFDAGLVRAWLERN
jgi:Tripartite tricarboxylate transporter TctB family